MADDNQGKANYDIGDFVEFENPVPRKFGTIIKGEITDISVDTHDFPKKVGNGKPYTSVTYEISVKSRWVWPFKRKYFVNKKHIRRLLE